MTLTISSGVKRGTLHIIDKMKTKMKENEAESFANHVAPLDTVKRAPKY